MHLMASVTEHNAARRRPLDEIWRTEFEALHRESTRQTSFLGVTPVEDRMSINVKVSASAAEGINAPRQQSYLWTAVLIVGAIAACAIAAWFYVDATLLDASMVGP
jgi:hypothetical protein